MSTLTISVTHVGPNFLRHIAVEYGIGTNLRGLRQYYTEFTFIGRRSELITMWRRYFLGDPSSHEIPDVKD